MKDKKELIIGIIIVIVVLFVGGFFGTKIYYLNKYNIVSISDTEYNEYKDKLKIKNTITIKNEYLNENEYITFNDIKIRNDFENFENLKESESEDNLKLAIYENEKVTKSFWFGGTTYSYIEILTSDDFDFFTSDITSNIKLTTHERKNFFKRYNITNDLELIEFLNNYDYKKNTILTKTSKMKDNYFVKYLVSILMSGGNGIIKIAGDYEGYILDLSNIKESYIFKNNKKYVFTFINTDYFTNEYINDLLNTVVIEDE